MEDTIQNNFLKPWEFSRQKGKYLWRSSFLAKSLSLRFTPILLMILKLMILWTLTREAVVRRCSVEKVFLRISQYSQEDICLESLFTKVAERKPCNFIRKRLQHRCFLTKFFRTGFYKSSPVAASKIENLFFLWLYSS